MRTQNIEQAEKTHQHPEHHRTDPSERLEFMRVPVGSFAGTLERVIIVRMARSWRGTLEIKVAGRTKTNAR